MNLAFKPTTLPLNEALARENGARFYRCALQVNPYQYLLDHAKSDSWGSEVAYNEAIIAACRDQKIEVIAVTDHHRASASRSLIEAAEESSIAAFPGFEAETKDGVHVLCLFERHTDPALLDSYLGECGVHKHGVTAPCKHDFEALLELVGQWNGVAIAAHIFSDKGLLKALSGAARANAWKLDRLVAVGIAGPLADVPTNFKKIVQNTDSAYKRERPLTFINCNDASSPSDLAAPAATTRIKMSSISLEGLRQAFLDPGSRIKLNSDPIPEERMSIVAVAFEGGFLDGLRLHLNPDLNVFIGGRGTGKSTVIESIRYALNGRALGKEAQESHDKLMRNVMGSGSKISLLIETHRPDRRRYIVERTMPNAPIVRDEQGGIVNVAPLQLLAGIEIFGQHEITEVTRSATALTELLGRFAAVDPALQKERDALSRRLEESRVLILRSDKENRRLSERLAVLPSLRDTLKIYQQAGVEERLKEQSSIVREEQLFRQFEERLDNLTVAVNELHNILPLDSAFLNDGTIENFPNKEVLRGLQPIITDLNREFNDLVESAETSLKKSRERTTSVYGAWSVKKSAVQSQYEKILRDLHKSKIDGEEFIRLRRQIEELTPLAASEKRYTELLAQQKADRSRLLADWEDLQGKEFRRLQKAASQVSEKLGGRLRISVTFSANHDQLLAHMRQIGFRTPETPQRKDASPFSLRDFAETIREGAEAITQKYRFSTAQAERLADASLEWQLQLTELTLAPATDIQLNLGGAGHDEWRSLDDLSTGQKATAVLLLLLIDSEAPLLVDQPEDDLDNRFISESVVPRIREAKGVRQFIFATHNANIPVLADAELIGGLTAIGEASGTGHASLDERFVGSIDKVSVAGFAEEILEGGKTAFVTRKAKYGF